MLKNVSGIKKKWSHWFWICNVIRSETLFQRPTILHLFCCFTAEASSCFQNRQNFFHKTNHYINFVVCSLKIVRVVGVKIYILMIVSYHYVKLAAKLCLPICVLILFVRFCMLVCSRINDRFLYSIYMFWNLNIYVCFI